MHDLNGADDLAEIRVNGERLLATTAGALLWPSRAALIVADLHFEKGASFARRGVMLPPYDTRTTLKRLETLCKRFKPASIISLGDAFHENEADQAMEDEDALRLERLVDGHNWIWILGNHDPEPPKRFAGAVHQELRMDGLTFRHEPDNHARPGELAGHLHPCARVRTDGRTQRRRCFVSDADRMILPAFGAYTGGLNILDEAFDVFFDQRRAWCLGARGVYPVASDLLVSEEPSMTRTRRAG